MVLVVTGQLVSTYDEEFRRLFARSTVPAVLPGDRPSVHYLRDAVVLQSPRSSQLSLHQRGSRRTHGMRGAHDERFANAAMLTRGLSVQEKLHQSHCPDTVVLMRGHSYGGELQKLNSMTRLRMGTKDIGVPVPPEWGRPNRRGGGDLPVTNRSSQQQRRHQTRYGADQNMIPFNSETSLHKWKMDAYLNEINADALHDVASPVVSPYSSHTGLNEYQSQQIHSRSRDIKSRMEELRQKRLSLQEYVSLRQSQESLRSMYPALERPKYMSSLRGLDMRQGGAELEANALNGWGPEPTNHRDTGPNKESNKRGPNLPDGHGSAPLCDAKMAPDPKTQQAYGRYKPPSRTIPPADSDGKSSSLNLQHPRAMESLTEVPEEKESSNTRTNNKPNLIFEESRGPSRGSRGSVCLGSATPTAEGNSASSDAEKVSKILKSRTEPQREEPTIQRKNSMKMKVHSKFLSDEKKSKKEEKSLQRSQNPSGWSQTLREERAQTPVNGQLGSQTSVSSAAETDKHKSPFPRLSSHRSSKRKMNLGAQQDEDSRSSPDSERIQARAEKTYSRYEYLLGAERSSSLKRHESGFPEYQTQSASDNKLGRFMQRMGNLIGKNK